MKVLSFRKNRYVARVSIFLLALVLVAGMVSCGGAAPAKYDLTMAMAPGGGGTATDLTNASPYAAGAAVSIKAEAATGYHFGNWAALAGTFDNAAAAQTTFTMPAQNVTVTANFDAFAGGSGTAGDPYQIKDWYQLDHVRNYTNSYFVLANDLDSSTAGYTELASSSANGGIGWVPIGMENQRFDGTFNGQGYQIEDLTISRYNFSCHGLFGVVGGGGVITNTRVDGTVFAGQGVGLLVGWNLGTVSTCSASGEVDGKSQVGGLVGRNDGTVSNSRALEVNAGQDLASQDVGGLVGSNTLNATVSDCYAYGSVTGSALVGGLVGSNSGTVSRCHVGGSGGGLCDLSSSVTGANYVGGLVGYNGGTVDSCSYVSVYTAINVTGSVLWVGGLVGFNSGNVSNSHAGGPVGGTDEVGGLVGFNGGNVNNSYSTGSVTGGSHLGGLVAFNAGNVSNSFWDTETSGQGSSDGGTGKSTADMKKFDTFNSVGWDIAKVANSDTRNATYVWNIVDTVTYPLFSCWESSCLY